MKKLYISCPRTGKTREEIDKAREKMHRIAEVVFEQELEVIDSFIPVGPPQTNAIAIWNLGENIKKMASADYFIGVRSCWDHPSCSIEGDVAALYMNRDRIFLIEQEMIGLPMMSVAPIGKHE